MYESHIVEVNDIPAFFTNLVGKEVISVVQFRWNGVQVLDYLIITKAL
jgi:hypothetical protein